MQQERVRKVAVFCRQPPAQEQCRDKEKKIQNFPPNVLSRAGGRAKTHQNVCNQNPTPRILREGHKAGSPVFCSVAWGQGGQHVVTASAADVAILIHDAAAVAAAGGRSSGSAAAAALSTIRLHKDGVTALAVAPGSGASLASGSIDHSVKFCSFPEGVFQSNIARFTLPIRSLAFNKKGTLLAAAGDDDGIKLIATIDNTISKVLKGHKGSTTQSTMPCAGALMGSSLLFRD
uniref:Uncharacterized protein n=1 Tax=Oryza meridionalis TaxID=40149 RepID=A0A0E0EPQ6_9ORYZ